MWGNKKAKLVLKERVESLIRERGGTGDIVWRDNLASTYRAVYEYLKKHPDRTFENFGVKE